MAEKDLIPMNMRTKEEQKEITTKAGIASGVARRKKRTMKELTQLLLNSKPTDKDTIEKIKMVFPDLKESEITNKVVLINEQIKKASLGDTKSFEVVRDTSGEKPVEKVESINEDKINILTINGKETKELL